jgi:hypothetical protein
MWWFWAELRRLEQFGGGKGVNCAKKLIFSRTFEQRNE